MLRQHPGTPPVEILLDRSGRVLAPDLYSARSSRMSGPLTRQSAMKYRIALLVLLCVCQLSTGCVRRRMTVQTSPPGATVYVDDQEIGTTPVSTSFIYYGTRKIQVVKDGYETETVLHRMKAPWYQIPPLDFVSENLVPREIRDDRIVQIEMQPQQVIPTNVLLDRAQQLRTSTVEGYSIPTPPTVPSSAPLPQPAGTAMPPAFQPEAPGATGVTPQPFFPPSN